MPRRAGLPFTSRHRSAVLPLDDLGPDTPDTPHIAGVDGPVKAHGWGKGTMLQMHKCLKTEILDPP